MKRLFTGIAIAGAMLLGVSASASAATFTFNFCPAAGTQCTNAGVTQVTASFTDIPNGDANDYNVTLTIVGGIAGSNVDEMLLSIGDLKYDADYESVSALSSDSSKPYLGPEADGLPGCGEAPLSGNDFCFYTAGNNAGEVAGPGITNTFTFSVNLSDAAPALTSTTAMNFRFQLEDSTGGNAAIFSPDGQYNTTTTSTTTTTTSTTTNNTTTSPSTVPEPGILALLGAGFGAAAQRLRRRRNG